MARSMRFLGLSVRITDPNLAKVNLAPHFQVDGRNDFKIPMNGACALGSIRAEEVDACDLFIAAKLKSATLEILDGENQPTAHQWHAALLSRRPPQQHLRHGTSR